MVASIDTEALRRKYAEERACRQRRVNQQDGGPRANLFDYGGIAGLRCPILYDLADMAASKGDTATKQWADGQANAMVKKFSAAWWMPGEGGPGCDPGTYTGHTQQAYTLNTGVMAVGLGNYGQLAPQQLGVDPQLGNGLLEVLPDVPPGQSSVSGTNIRVGTGSVDVAATHHGSSYMTTVTAGLSCTLHVGATVPAGATVHHVTLNGSPARYTVRDTNSGREVLVSTPCRGQTWQVHVVAG